MSQNLESDDPGIVDISFSINVNAFNVRSIGILDREGKDIKFSWKLKLPEGDVSLILELNLVVRIGILLLGNPDNNN